MQGSGLNAALNSLFDMVRSLLYLIRNKYNEKVKGNLVKYEPVIGLEVHAQLLTRSKIFCGCSTTFGEEPNTQTCPVCTGQPGSLPVINRKAVEFAIKLGLATSCRIAPYSLFARKNYFYPDLPKGYQISMYEFPLAEDGFIEIMLHGQKKRIQIIRIHLEEDAGKLKHGEAPETASFSYVDFNRTGVPLVEIVSGPDIRSPEELLRELKHDDREIDQCPVTPQHLAEMLSMIKEGTISGKIAKDVFEEMYRTGEHPEKIVRDKGWMQILDEGEIQKAIEKAMEANPKQVEDYRKGKEKLFGFFVGEVMKQTQGKANPKLVNELLKKKLK